VSVKTQFGEWRVTVEQPSRNCDGLGRTCRRTGRYGWDDKLYCYQHHPDWNQWLAELRRVGKIADKAFRSAMRAVTSGEQDAG